MHVLLDQKWAPVNVPSSTSAVVVVSGGVGKLNCSEMSKGWGLLKTFLTDEQKQQEALDGLRDLIDATENPHSERLIYAPVGGAIKQQ